MVRFVSDLHDLETLPLDRGPECLRCRGRSLNPFLLDLLNRRRRVFYLLHRLRRGVLNLCYRNRSLFRQLCLQYLVLCLGETRLTADHAVLGNGVLEHYKDVRDAIFPGPKLMKSGYGRTRVLLTVFLTPTPVTSLTKNPTLFLPDIPFPTGVPDHEPQRYPYSCPKISLDEYERWRKVTLKPLKNQTFI